MSTTASVLEGMSGNFTFTTASAGGPVPTISAVTASAITATSATVTWTTDQAANTLVNYGTTAAYGSSSPLNSTLVTSHSVTLTGLTPGTTYNYDVVSVNASNASTTSGNFTFATSSVSSICGSGYQNCRMLTLNHNLVGSNPSPNFPVVFADTYPWMKTTQYGGPVIQTATQTVGGVVTTVPGDLIFAKDATCSTALPREFESYKPDTGAAVVWVQIPSLLSSTDTTIYACYGNTSVSSVSANGTWDPNYKAVYHMNDAVTTGVQTLTDSTSNANGLTTAVSNGSSFASITGKISNAVRFVQTNMYNGSSAFSSSPSGAGTGPVTLEMWLNTLNPSSLDGGNIGQDIGILNQTGNGSGFWVMVGASATGNVNLLEGVLKNGSSTGAPNAVAGQAAAGNTWYHVVLSYDGSSTTTLYVNGTSAGSYPGAWTRTDGPISIVSFR